MKYNLFFIMAVVLLLALPLCSSKLGTFKYGDCVQIVTNSNSTAVNISGITTPVSAIVSVNTPMTRNGSFFNYTFCSTSIIGIYTYGYCDLSGACFSNDFEITSTGKNNGTILPLFIFLGAFLVFGIALWQKNPIIGFFAGALFIIGGIYMMRYGFSIFADDYTEMISYVTLGFGFVISFISMIELFQGGESEED